MKAMWVCALCLALGAMLVNRPSDSFVARADHSELATLASLYHTSDPYVLTTALTKPEMRVVRRTREADYESKLQHAAHDSSNKYFSDYVLLHRIRVEAADPGETNSSSVGSH